jgi:uncharacterized integral membrane protein
MSERDDDALSRARRTRTGRVWVALVPALVFLILLIIFIAQNGQSAHVKFLGADGHISLALALLISAVAGAVVVLLVGTLRIAQLRLAARRHRQADRQVASAPATGGEVQPVEPERDPDQTAP